MKTIKLASPSTNAFGRAKGLDEAEQALAIQPSSVIVNYNTSSLIGREALGVNLMSAHFGRYLNDVVSLSVMLLMAIALISAQAAGGENVGAQAAPHATESPASLLEASVLIETGSTVTTIHFDMHLDNFIDSLPVENTTEAIGEIVAGRLKLRK